MTMTMVTYVFLTKLDRSILCLTLIASFPPRGDAGVHMHMYPHMHMHPPGTCTHRDRSNVRGGRRSPRNGWRNPPQNWRWGKGEIHSSNASSSATTEKRLPTKRATTKRATSEQRFQENAHSYISEALGPATSCGNNVVVSSARPQGETALHELSLSMPSRLDMLCVTLGTAVSKVSNHGSCRTKCCNCCCWQS